MKVLWFSANPSLYSKNIKGTHKFGAGWVASLEEQFIDSKKIELGIAFFHTDDVFKKRYKNVTYYPINIYDSTFKKLRHNLCYSKSDKIEIEYFKKVIKDFKPDIIHIWGTEGSFGLLITQTDIPCVIHIQGILGPIFNTFFIPGTDKSYFLKNFKRVSLFNPLLLKIWKHNTAREELIYKHASFFIGRTDWDEKITSLLSKKSKYFYCSEILRKPFYSDDTWRMKDSKKLKITSVLSDPTYKGIDLVLKTAKLVDKQIEKDFEWNIYGVSDLKYFEKLTKIKGANVNVHAKGSKNETELKDILLDSDIFIHPSYIDNSPNSVCEAQILGLPVIATNVGGVSSLISNNIDGILVPANDPYYLASTIKFLIANPELMCQLGRKARLNALRRHEPEKITNDLYQTYTDILNAKI